MVLPVSQPLKPKRRSQEEAARSAQNRTRDTRAVQGENTGTRQAVEVLAHVPQNMNETHIGSRFHQMDGLGCFIKGPSIPAAAPAAYPLLSAPSCGVNTVRERSGILAWF